ncbi:hypothetical protein CSV69_10235 [Sporosarcina sp. P26b]|uniref:hypothetical protein n=1 Tax=Sporosarcina sp. P26b TaxID=2048253 RepID=UPI000C16F882|nr:hypothetical protein [Sporosarcina sp. P26b]PIC95709.1 hypothetical protein CSV69_10235 [Sporosarcina sp. P26b]
MKKATKVSLVAALAVSALTPAMAIGAETNHAAPGFYNVDTGTVVSADAFVLLSNTEKVNLLKNSNVYYADGQGKVVQATKIIDSKTDAALVAALFPETELEADKNVSLTPEGTVVPGQTAELKVESVKAINAKTVEVKFTQPVKEATVITSKKLNDTNVKLKSLETPAQGFTGANAAAELSEDGKTLTITADASEIFEGRYQVLVENVETTKSEKLPKFDEIVNLGKDTTAPSLASVEKVNASTTKVTYSEAIKNLGTGTTPGAGLSYSFKLADGTVVPSADVTVTVVDDKTVNVVASATKYAGKTITATVLGAMDYSNNLINPNPSTFNFQIGAKDGVAPTVTSTKAISPTQIEVNFSEEVQGFNTANAADFTLSGASGTIAAVTATKIEQDNTDKKKYIVTLSGSALESGVTSAAADVKIVKTNITDLSGEELAADYASIVTIKKDTVAPKHVATKVVQEGTDQWLVVEFDEKLDATATSAVVPVALSATSFKDFVTVSGKSVTFGSSLALTTDEKGVKVKLADIQFDSGALLDGTKYTFDVNAKDAAGNVSDAIKVEFTSNDKADSTKPKVDTTSALTGKETVAVTFDRELDGASAINVANYNIAGVTIEKAVLSPLSGGKQIVTLTLGKNEQSGARAITVSGVKSKSGVAMDTFNSSVTLTENVKPTVTAAKVTTTKTIELTFSENVVLTGVANFDVFIGDSTTAETGVSSVAETTTTNKTVITLTTALTDADLAKTITVKPASGADVKDASGNVLDFKSIVVTK